MNICDGVKWSIEPITDCSWEAVQEMLPQVSEQRRAQALLFKHAFGQYACLKSYLMLQNLLREHYGIEGDLLFTYNEYGKPELDIIATNRVGGGLKPYFSISHCKQAIAVAVADTPVGIDIETLRHPSCSLIEKTMNEQEQKQIAAAESPDNIFTALWTRKEAVLKYKGTGIIDNLNNVLSYTHQCHITTFQPSPTIFCSICVNCKEISATNHSNADIHT